MVYLSLYKVADTSFHSQGDEFIFAHKNNYGFQDRGISNTMSQKIIQVSVIAAQLTKLTQVRSFVK